MSASGGQEYNVRLVVLGGGQTGKSSILKRFLFNTWNDKHRPTVEEIYQEDFNLGGGSRLRVEFVDTAGDLQFPAMRRLAISSGQAFLLVYAVDDAESWAAVQECAREVWDTAKGDAPVVIAANKSDLPAENRQVSAEEATAWMLGHGQKARHLECSAKEDKNIRELFRTFLQLARIPEPVPSGLRRRSSAHASRGNSSSSASTGSPVASKPRSRSLIRRTSKKLAAKFKESSPAPGRDDCAIS